MKIAKKSWSEPELIVLVRGKPEEEVLGVCKDGSGNGPSGGIWHCAEVTCCCAGSHAS